MLSYLLQDSPYSAEVLPAVAGRTAVVPAVALTAVLPPTVAERTAVVPAVALAAALPTAVVPLAVVPTA